MDDGTVFAASKVAEVGVQQFIHRCAVGAVGGRTLLTARCFLTRGAALSLIEGGEVRNVGRRHFPRPALVHRGEWPTALSVRHPSIVESTIGSRRGRGDELNQPEPLRKPD
jgi:hypothetical protein